MILEFNGLLRPARRLQDHERVERGNAAIAADIIAQVGRVAATGKCEAKHSIGEASAITAFVVANSDGSSGFGRIPYFYRAVMLVCIQNLLVVALLLVVTLVTDLCSFHLVTVNQSIVVEIVPS